MTPPLPCAMCFFCGGADTPGHPCDGRQGRLEAVKAPTVTLQVILDAVEGDRLKTIGMAQAAAGSGDAFREVALIAVETVARRQPQFVSDDVWVSLALTEIAAPKDHRALGPVMRVAQGRGWIEPTDVFQLTDQPRRHRAPVRIWRSLLWSAA